MARPQQPPRPAVASTAQPMVDVLQRELQRAGIGEVGKPPARLEDFARWYLAVVQRLEVFLARDSDTPPMARGEVELMCRAAMSAPDLAGAIALCTRFSSMLYPRAGALRLSVSKGVASLQLDSLRETTTSTSSLVDITGLFAFRQLLQWLSGRQLPLQQVCIGPIQREDVMPFLKLFGAPVLAGGSVYALEFDAAALQWSTVRSAAEFDTFFALFPCAVFDLQSSQLDAQVAALLEASLRRGEGLPTQAQMAELLAMPLSTLRRRLRDLGLNYRQLRTRCLQVQAGILLRRGELSVAQIAARLGFSDAGAFRRAFRQWYGCSPRDWLAGVRDHSYNRR